MMSSPSSADPTMRARSRVAFNGKATHPDGPAFALVRDGRSANSFKLPGKLTRFPAHGGQLRRRNRLLRANASTEL